MIENRRSLFGALRSVIVAMALGLVAVAPTAQAETASEIDKAADEALQALLADTPEASGLADQAKAILVFPSITKAGLIVGGEYGEGVLRRNGESVAYHSLAEGSVGLQAGFQNFSYVMMFLNEEALGYLDTAAGWEVGVGPSIVVVDKGVAGTLTTATYEDDVYVFTLDQTGLMAGAGLQGSKITKIDPAP